MLTANHFYGSCVWVWVCGRVGVCVWGGGGMHRGQNIDDAEEKKKEYKDTAHSGTLWGKLVEIHAQVKDTRCSAVGAAPDGTVCPSGTTKGSVGAALAVTICPQPRGETAKRGTSEEESAVEVGTSGKVGVVLKRGNGRSKRNSQTRLPRAASTEETAG